MKKNDVHVKSIRNDPVITNEVQRIVTTGGEKELIVPHSSEVNGIVKHFYDKMKGSNKAFSTYSRSLCWNFLERYSNMVKFKLSTL